MTPSAHHPHDGAQEFMKHWEKATADSNLTLHGFRRFKTTQLLNLRFLEDEIATVDHGIYQAGLSLGLDPSSSDRLGLRHSKRDANVPPIEETITRAMVLRLRGLLKEYGPSLYLVYFEACQLIRPDSRRRPYCLQSDYGHGDVLAPGRRQTI